WDKSFVALINQLHTPFGDVLMYWTYEKLTWVPFYVLLIILLIKNFGWSTLYYLVAIALTITLADQLTSSFMKPFFARLRPCHSPDLPNLLLPAGCGGSFGFASSHAANTFGLAMVISLIFSKVYRYVGLMFLWASFVSFSRVYLAAHYFTDILVGACLGMGIGWCVWKLLQFVRLKTALKSS
ncbi:MAG: phosphatase PAP2 family protein, partial [Bacteroidota bacterium]